MNYKYYLVSMLVGIFANTSAQTNNLKVTIQGVKNEKGEILIGLYNSEKSFLKIKYKVEKIKATEGEVSVIFTDLPSGEYGIAVVHDQDSNGKFNSNLFGFPTEGFGFSNNAKGILGPPSFAKAKFIIGGENANVQEYLISLTLRYL